MLKSYKYRLYPTTEQRQKIDRTIGVCRLLYNLALEVKIRAYKEHGVSLSAYDIQKELKDIRKEYSWIKEVSSQAIVQSVGSIDAAFKNFFSRGFGYPAFKKKRNGGSFRQPDNYKIDWVLGLISIPKIKNIPIVLSRKFMGDTRTATITKTPTGKYYISILVEDNQPIVAPGKKEIAIGIDLGISSFAVLSTGEKIANPRYLHTKLNRLKVLQRRVSRKKNGSRNQKKAHLIVSRLHEKIASQRLDFLHKLSTKLISDNQTDTICVEGISVSNMVRNKKLSRAINDVSWSEFIRQLEYKGRWYRKNVVKIDRFYPSSKTCSACGNIKEEIDLLDREWVCQNCGSKHDRDINAAINIRNSGVGSPGEPIELSAIAEALK